MERLAGQGRVVIGDSWFASMNTLRKLKGQGNYFSRLIKNLTAESLLNICGANLQNSQHVEKQGLFIWGKVQTVSLRMHGTNRDGRMASILKKPQRSGLQNVIPRRNVSRGRNIVPIYVQMVMWSKALSVFRKQKSFGSTFRPQIASILTINLVKVYLQSNAHGKPRAGNSDCFNQ